MEDRSKSKIILLLRVCGFLFCGFLGYVHLDLGRNPVYQAGLTIFIPVLSGSTLFLISFVYIYEIGQSSCKRSKPSVNSCVPETNPSTFPSRVRSIWNFLKRGYGQVFDADGLLGQNGDWYEYCLILRSLIEIPGQTYQAYQLSQRIPDSILPMMFTIVIVLESISVSVILSLRMTDQRQRRSWMLLCDILGDFCFGIIFPLALALSPLLELDKTKIDDLNWTTKVLATVKHLVITSELDLLLTSIPMISMHFLLKSLSLLWLSKDDGDTSTTHSGKKKDPEKLQSVASLPDPVQKPSKLKPDSEPRFPSRNSFKWTAIGPAIGVVWGIAVLAIAISAKFNTACSDLEQDICISPLQPWFASSTSKCSCLIVQVNCDQNQNLINNMETLFDVQLENHIRYLTISNCPITTTPASLLQHDQVWYFIVQDCTALAEWTIPMTQYHNLIGFTMTNTAFIQLPTTFEQLPPGLFTIILEKMPLSHLPDSIAHGWSQLRDIQLRKCNFTHFPEVVTSLSNVYLLHLADNSIPSIPPSIANLQQLQGLHMAGNRLTSFPEVVTSLSNLYWLHLADNSIPSIPPSIANLQQLQVLRMAGNRLTSFPEVVTSLSNLYYMDLNDNSIPSIPPSIANLQQLKVLRMAGNQIQELPTELINMKSLRSLTLAMNNISSIDKLLRSLLRLSTLDELQDWTYDPIDNNRGNPDGFLSLSGNPVCDLEELQQADVCFEDCAPLCDRLRLKNGLCDSACNIESCQYDHGACSP